MSKAEVAPVVEPTKQQLLTTADMVVLEEIIANPQANIKFKTGKDGRLNVLIQEVKQ